MDKRWKSRAVLVLAIGWMAVATAPSAQEPDRGGADLAKVKPQWKVGDQWIVETTTVAIQMRSEPGRLARSRPIPWQFTVEKEEKLTDDCYRIEVRCLLEGPPQPTTVLWIDKRSGALRQVQTQYPSVDGFRTATESYDSTTGQPTPVLSMLTALPVDLPAFQGSEVKGLEKYVYEARAGQAGMKAPGDLGFAFEVEQDVTQPAAEQVKGLVEEDFTKDLAERPAVEVRLKGLDRQVRQLWRPGLPWPVYSDNGMTTARLVKVTPANAPGNER